MRVKFLEDRVTKVGNKASGKHVHDKDAVEDRFDKDGVYDLSEASANHWINRGVAVEMKAETKRAEPPRSIKLAKETVEKE